jgi:hypothetical protein
MTDLSRELIAANLQEALNNQLQALDFHGLAVETKPKTLGGTPMVSLCFKSVDGVPLTAVLSHGEQRRLALAMFLAEMEVLSDPSPVVFDDPTSSIDQEGRRHIARTIVRLAAERQVIVFTHELSLIYELQRAAPSELPQHLQQVRRLGKTVGHVADGLPWQGLKAKQRVDPLLGKLRTIEKLYEARNEDAYEPAVIDFCSSLRQAFERAVEEEILGDVVTRRTDTTHPTALRKVICTEKICDMVERGVDENSPWLHDQARADGAAPPNPGELREGLEVFKGLLSEVKAARARPEDPRNGPHLTPVQSEEDTTEPEVAQPKPLRVVSGDGDGSSRKPA